MNNGKGIGPRGLGAPKSMAKQVTDPKKGKNFSPGPNFSQKAAWAQQRAAEKKRMLEYEDKPFSDESVKDAKANTGRSFSGTRYKEYQGKEVKSGGRTTGFKSHDGSFTSVTNKGQLAGAKKAFEKEKALYNKRLKANKAMRERAATQNDPKKGKH